MKPARVADADPWFVDLGTVGARVSANQRRVYVLAAFLLAAFMLLAWRTEVNADRIRANAEVLRVEQVRLEQTRQESCLRGVIIIGKFNRLQDELARIEREFATDPEAKRAALAAAYEGGRILPLPNCPPNMEVRP